MRKSDLRIDVLGTTLTISTDEDPVYLDKLLLKYRNTIENVRRVSGLDDPLKIAVLTGFLISHDLEKSSAPSAADGGETNEALKLTLGMISRLEEALGGTSQSQSIQEAQKPDPLYETINETIKEEQEKEPEKEAEKVLSPNESNKIGVYRLQNTVKNYDWGSPEWIPALLNRENPSKAPWAELWMGVNPGAPSKIVHNEKLTEEILLSEFIAHNSRQHLGEDTYNRYGRLPFLLKILAVSKPLSIQVHPNKIKAKEGYERENLQGIALGTSKRNYSDPNHKPEIICALGPFIGLCGFRTVLEIHTILTKLSLLVSAEGNVKDSLEKLLSVLKDESESSYRDFLMAIFELDTDALIAIGSFIKSHGALLELKYPDNLNEWKLVAYFTSLKPGDPGILAPLYLNIIEMKPGEAMYLPSGIPHAYIHGMGLELMADSDNVLRGGLSSKHIDKTEFLDNLVFAEFKPELIKYTDNEQNWFDYVTVTEEFELSQFQCKNSAINYPECSASIVVICEGNAKLTNLSNKEELRLKTGDSIFIPSGLELAFEGNFKAFSAHTGKARNVNLLDNAF